MYNQLSLANCLLIEIVSEIVWNPNKRVKDRFMKKLNQNNSLV